MMVLLLCQIAVVLVILVLVFLGLRRYNRRDGDQEARDKGELPYDYYKKGR